MNSEVRIDALMQQSRVKFGTSGARGLVTHMTDFVCAAYTLAFLDSLRDSGRIARATSVVVGGDLRPSTPRIARAVSFAAESLGHPVEWAGYVPSPAVALRGLETSSPSIMVTGSHIPDDRNGIKFNTPEGEITKEDEAAVRARAVTLPDVFDEAGAFLPTVAPPLPDPAEAALHGYRQRFLRAFPPGCLTGLTLGIYGHSAVGRDLLVSLYEELGATVLPLGFSDTFIPVDTEAIRDEDMALARRWAASHRLDAILSTDGDSDRPLTFDESGHPIRGDVSGIITARFLGADAVATPVSCNSAVELSREFSQVLRSKIGSPFVIEKMEQARRAGAKAIVGYEANGGFLTLSNLVLGGGRELPALPTRDAVIVHLALLLSAKSSGMKLSEVLAQLPARFTASGRDQAFSQKRSEKLLKRLSTMNPGEHRDAFGLGPLFTIDTTDGMRFSFEAGEIVHLRPSGNAPELRCYAEASSEQRAEELVVIGLAVARKLAPEK